MRTSINPFRTVIFILLTQPILGQMALASDLYSTSLDDGVGWGVNASSSDTAVTFGYDYSVDGIPEAPNPAVSASSPIFLLTTGIKVEANINNPGSSEFLTLFPIGEHFTGNYQLRFDAWINHGFVQTTEFLGGGIGYNGLSPDVNSGAQIIATGDGGSSRDWRAFENGFLQLESNMAAGTSDANGANTYYSDFLPQVNSPFEQSQGSVSTAGSPGFQWITFELTHTNGMVRVDIEKPDSSKLNITTLDCTGGFCSTDGNISLFYADYFSSVASFPELNFGIFDNVIVSTVTPSTVPGDYDSDLDVDGADYLIWQQSYGSTTNLAADGNADGVVDAADYTVWRDNYGSPTSTATASAIVPEPSSVFLAATCFALLGSSRIRRRKELLR